MTGIGMQFEGKLDEWKGRLKKRWAKLTDDDLKRVEGDMERLVGVIKAKTGESQRAIEKELKRLREED